MITLQSISSVEKHPPTLGSLRDRVQAIFNLRNDGKQVEAITALADLLPGLTSFLSYGGERRVSHDAYTDSANLNDTAQLWMHLGHDCADHNTPFRTRLLQYSLFEKFKALYQLTEKSLKVSTVLWFLNGVREFELGCAHCSGRPQYCVLHDEERMRDGVLYVRQEIYSEMWPDTPSQGEMFRLSGKTYRTLMLVSIAQLEEAAAHENEESC